LSVNNIRNIPPSEDAAREPRGTWPVVGGRCHPDDLYLIERAALEIGMKRGPFMIKVATERARAILEAAA